MAEPQTTETIAYQLNGAVMIEVAELESSTWVDAGAVIGAKFNEELTVSTIESDNVEDRKLVTDQKAMIEFEQIEFMNDDVREITRGGLDLVTNIPATPVSAHNQTALDGAWSWNVPIALTFKNSSGAMITPTTVTGGTDGLLVEDTDYFVSKIGSVSYVTIVDSATVTIEGQDMVIVYDYTPIASQEVTTGGISVIPEFQARFTNTDENGKIVQWLFFKCSITKGFELEFQKYNAEDSRVKNPTSFEAMKDSSLANGAQLYKKTETL